MSKWTSYRPLWKLLAGLALLAALTYACWYWHGRVRLRDDVGLPSDIESEDEAADLLSAPVTSEDGGGKLYHLWYFPDDDRDAPLVTLRMDALRGAELVTTYLVVDGARQEHGSGWYSADFGIALVVTGLADGEDPEDIDAVEVWERYLDGTERFLRRFLLDNH